MFRKPLIPCWVVALVTLAVFVPAPGWGREEAPPYRDILTWAYAEDEPGAVALVARGDRILYLDAVGVADLELGVRLSPDMVFSIGSITKQFTAAGILMLAEQGLLALSDPVTRHLPGYPSYGDNVTIEHLLSHTSGIVSYTDLPRYLENEVVKDVSVEALIDSFDELPLKFAPGEEWAYSNSGYALLGAIIEKVSGMRYEEFMEERMFRPLGMESSFYGSHAGIIPGRVSGYDGGEEGYANQHYLSYTHPYAAGALMMTVEDWHRWARALFGGEVVGAQWVARMTTPFVLNDGRATHYGYGFRVDEVRGRRAVRHAGEIFGFQSDALYLPEEDTYVAVFSNNRATEMDPVLVTTKLAAAAIGEPFPQFQEVALDEEALRRFEGLYGIEDGVQRIVRVRDGGLFTQRSGQSWMRAYPASDAHFFYRNSLSHFQFVVEDEKVKMLMYQGGSPEPEEAVRIAQEVPAGEQVRVDRTVLEGYVGVYELDYDQPGYELTILLEDGKLMVRGNWGEQEAGEMIPLSPTEFTTQEVLRARITFVVAEDGTVAQLVLHMDGRDVPARRTSQEIPAGEQVRVDRTVLEGYVGVYELDYDQPGYELTILLEDGKLMVRGNWGEQEAGEMIPLSPTEFTTQEVFRARITFVVAEDGTVAELVLHMDGRDVPARRKGERFNPS